MKKTLEGADLSGAGAPFEEALLDLVEKHPAIQPRFTCEGGGDRASCIFGVALPGML